MPTILSALPWRSKLGYNRDMQANLPTMPENRTPDVDRRRLRFSLRTLLIVTTVAALVLGVTTKELVRHSKAARVAAQVRGIGGSVHWNSEVLETLLRDQALTRITDVHFNNPSFPDEQWAVLQEMPQRFGLHVTGKQFGDAGLAQLRQVPKLRYLVLNDTTVTEDGLAALKDAMPNLHIMFGYPGDVNFREIP